MCSAFKSGNRCVHVGVRRDVSVSYFQLLHGCKYNTFPTVLSGPIEATSAKKRTMLGHCKNRFVRVS